MRIWRIVQYKEINDLMFEQNECFFRWAFAFSKFFFKDSCKIRLSLHLIFAKIIRYTYQSFLLLKMQIPKKIRRNYLGTFKEADVF